MSNKSKVKVHKPRLRGGVTQFDLTSLPQCGAKTRRGTLCKRYGNLRNGRCKFHGGRSVGPKRDVTGANNPNYRNGLYTRDANEERDQIRRHLKECKELLIEIE